MDTIDRRNEMKSIFRVDMDEMDNIVTRRMHGKLTEEEARYALEVNMILHAERCRNYLKLTATPEFKERFEL